MGPDPQLDRLRPVRRFYMWPVGGTLITQVGITPYEEHMSDYDDDGDAFGGTRLSNGPHYDGQSTLRAVIARFKN